MTDLKVIHFEEAKFFGNTLGKVLSAGRPWEPNEANLAIHPMSALEMKGDYTISVFLVGTVFGELCFSIDYKLAKAICEKNAFPDPAEEDIQDFLRESLNMAAGSCMSFLGDRYDRLTITSPRILRGGSIRFPSVHGHKGRLQLSERDSVEFGFYLDSMKLDIVEGFQQGLTQLQAAHTDLLFANEKIKLQQMQLIQAEKMASLGTMAAGVAHEINNPLSFVLSNSEVLQSYMDAFRELFQGYRKMIQYLNDRKARDAMGALRKVQEMEAQRDIDYILDDTLNLMQESRSGLDRIRSIVNGLKRFSRIEEEGEKEIDLNEEISTALNLIGNELKYRCKVKTDFKELPKLRCKPGALGQVFVNLLVNAAQAMPAQGGEVSIGTRLSSEGICIDIQDTGVGISPQHLPKIFDPFFTTKPVGQGTGLGLSISYGIVRDHGGSIQVESTQGKGTKFTIFLPLPTKEEAPKLAA